MKPIINTRNNVSTQYTPLFHASGDFYGVAVWQIGLTTIPRYLEGSAAEDLWLSLQERQSLQQAEIVRQQQAAAAQHAAEEQAVVHEPTIETPVDAPNEPSPETPAAPVVAKKKPGRKPAAKKAAV